ncbi:MAG: serine hydrolase [bacterium]|nr:serine hydrolase [bacterium]
MKKFLPVAILIIVIAVFLAGIGFFAWRFFSSRIKTPPQKGITNQSTTQKRAEKQEALLETIKDISSAISPSTSVSVAIYDLKTNEYFGFDDTKTQHAASISKILTAVYAYDQAEKGNIKLTDPMGAYDVETQIQFLINQSSVDSWELLDQRFTAVEQNKYAASIGLAATDLTIGKNLMSPKDVAVLLKKLAKGEILTDVNRSKLLSYMQKTESEDFFPPAFKEQGALFYHKAGKHLGEGHDTAIVKLTNNPFILVVFSNNTASSGLLGRGPLLTKIAGMVFEYFDETN